jgi:hypothetical protein
MLRHIIILSITSLIVANSDTSSRHLQLYHSNTRIPTAEEILHGIFCTGAIFRELCGISFLAGNGQLAGVKKWRGTLTLEKVEDIMNTF